MFPYYLLPNDDTKEADEDQQPSSYDPLSSIRPPKPAPTPQPDKKPPRSNKPKYTLAEQIRRRNQERAKQDAAAQKRLQSALKNHQNNMLNKNFNYVVAGSGTPKNKVDESPPVLSGQSSTGFSEMEETLDFSEARDETSVQATAPDIEEVQDGYGADGLSLDRMYAYSNLGILRVEQDAERRPLTFKLCFEQSQSPRAALEFLYAEPPDCNDRELTYLQRQIKQQIPLGMGGGGTDDTHDNDSPDIGLDILDYEEDLESTYGYQIEWGTGSPDTNMFNQLQNLGQASKHIVNYLRQKVFDDDRKTALSVFQQNFSQSEAYGQLVIHLGDDDNTKGAFYGRVPLYGSSQEELRSMYLGSAVEIPTIVHEFGHVIDRNVNFTDHLEESVTETGESRMVDKTDVNLNSDILKWIIEGFVAKQFFGKELWADLFMTAVLASVSDETFVVKSIRDTDIDTFAAFTDPNIIFKCGIDATCIDKEIKWKDRDLAVNVREYLPEAFRELLSE